MSAASTVPVSPSRTSPTPMSDGRTHAPSDEGTIETSSNADVENLNPSGEHGSSMALPGTLQKGWFSPRGYLITMGGLILLALLAEYIPQVFDLQAIDRSFMERDPALSVPSVSETVSAGELVALVLVLPLGIIVASILAVYCWRYGIRQVPWKEYLRSLLPITCVLVSSGALALAITNVLKFSVGAKRPNFFALCNYKGYLDAIEVGLSMISSSFLKQLKLGMMNDCAVWKLH
eukprot:gb/GECG01001525.1/.p1 GENE.gb/GECG01001525.1/~~gb/GECG01001525.1/.p1  ORF type:complete len:234 (+),score=15.21 gb/GECG01001525.1/:1-702(+)